MSRQTTDTLLMIRPARFGYNAETAENNAFQHQEGAEDVHAIHNAALAEFDAFVEVLRAAGVEVIVEEDRTDPDTPDAIFPNNWFSTHASGNVVLYPLLAESRRLERRLDIFQRLADQHGRRIAMLVDLSVNEVRHRALEGTGSMVFDRQAQVAYACLSPRTDPLLLEEFARMYDFRAVVFVGEDVRGEAIYHTNVMMHVGSSCAVVCLDAIADEEDREMVRASLVTGGKDVIPISLEQMDHFAGNMLEVRGTDDRRYTVMSQQARDCLTDEQRVAIEAHTGMLSSPLDTIERYGGGSARCMMAEIFLPRLEA